MKSRMIRQLSSERRKIAGVLEIAQQHNEHIEGDTATILDANVETNKSEPPPLYRVFIINDDFTPMEFVVAVLGGIFHFSEQKAVELMLQVHNEGRAVCGIFTKDIAQTKVEYVRTMAKKEDHPLACECEENK